ncbi:MAG TPA: hypothetical protein VFI84_02690 [Candidatus Saccharimonadales bacterium]|nr:hypothetical protein [Candidatus Saccharimonadales bacterium]
MIDELNVSLQKYSKNWEKLVAERNNKEFFEGLKPVAVGWKVADEAEYKKVYEELRGQCDRIVETWMNGRWIAKMHLKDAKLTGNIEIIKLMQRRPGSSDALGLDHVDFYSPAVAGADAILKQEPGLKWSWESNDVVDDYDWISIWFSGTEAKLKAGTVIDIVIKELAEVGDRIKA